MPSAKPVQSAPDGPLLSYLTLDLLVHVLSRSLFHPFVAWLIPLCLRSLSIPYSHPHFRYACVYATAITLFAVLRLVDQRLAWGPPRQLDWENEVVVITGGSGGLGRVLAEMFGRKGLSVAVLDVREPEDQESEGWQNCTFYHCDVGDPEAVARIKEEIEKDLSSPATILINNAGILNAAPLLSLTPRQLSRNFNVNLLAHFHTIRTFLPAMQASPTGGTIVTVASVLGKLGTANLSDYTAAKAGLIAMHASLRAEISSHPKANIRTILVTPGQLSTPLFAGVTTPSNFFGPVVEPVELARKIVEMVEQGVSGEISEPFYAKWIGVLGVLPWSLQRVARWGSGVDGAMEGVVRERARREGDEGKKAR